MIEEIPRIVNVKPVAKTIQKYLGILIRILLKSIIQLIVNVSVIVRKDGISKIGNLLESYKKLIEKTILITIWNITIIIKNKFLITAGIG